MSWQQGTHCSANLLPAVPTRSGGGHSNCVGSPAGIDFLNSTPSIFFNAPSRVNVELNHLSPTIQAERELQRPQTNDETVSSQHLRPTSSVCCTFSICRDSPEDGFQRTIGRPDLLILVAAGRHEIFNAHVTTSP